MPFEQIANAVQGTDVARANLLTNGGFEIWQRGNGPFTPGMTYSADKWRVSGSNVTVQRTTVVDPLGGSQSNGAAVVTVADSSTVNYWVNDMENGDALRGRVHSFTIRVRTAVANKLRAYCYDGATEYWSSYHTGNDAWQTLSMTITPGGTGGLMFGLTWDAHAAGGYYVDNAMLVAGSVPTAYAPMLLADELARCQRYYEILGGQSNDFLITGYQTAGGSIQLPLSFAAKKAIVPAMTKVGTWTVANTVQPTLSPSSVSNASMTITATATGTVATATNGGSTYIVAEANP